MKNYDYYRENYDTDYEIHKLTREPKKKKPSPLYKAYGYFLLITFMISVSMLDSVSFMPTIVLAFTLMLGTIYLYLGGHLDGY